MPNNFLAPGYFPALTAVVLLSLTGLNSKVLSAHPPPSLTCPASVTRECEGGLTPVLFSVTAVDSAGGSLSVACVPPSGTAFRLGTSNVVCTAMDLSGNAGTCSFVVRIVDSTPPAMDCPTNMTVQSTNGTDALVHYLASTSDACGLSQFDCIPRPGSRFPIGVSIVRCDATDTSGNTNFCTFRVEVGETCLFSACEAVQQCIALVEASGIPLQRKRPLIASLNAACASFERGNDTSGLNQLQAFESKVRVQISPDDAGVAQTFLACAEQIINAVECAQRAHRK